MRSGFERAVSLAPLVAVIVGVIVLLMWRSAPGVDLVVGVADSQTPYWTLHNACGGFKISQRENGDLLVTCPGKAEPLVTLKDFCKNQKARAVKVGDGAKISCVPK